MIVVNSLQDLYQHEPHHLPLIKAVYNRKASRRYSDLLHHIRHNLSERPSYLPEDVYRRIMDSMNEPGFKDKSEKAKLSRSKGSKHTGGSRPFYQHKNQLVSIYYDYLILT